MSSLDAIGNGTLIDWQHQKSKMHSIFGGGNLSISTSEKEKKQIKRKKLKWQDLSICASVRELLICFVSQQDDDDDDIERRPAIPQSRVRVRWLWKSRERHKISSRVIHWKWPKKPKKKEEGKRNSITNEQMKQEKVFLFPRQVRPKP